MMLQSIRISPAIGVIALAAATATTSPAAAQQKELGWSFTGRLTTVFASGNSTANTLGIGSTLRRVGPATEFKVEAGAVRTESGTTTRRAVGTPGNYRVEEETTYRKTAEAMYARGRHDRGIGDSFIVFAGVDWLRNTFAGIDNRFLIATGAGNVWADSERFRFKTNYGVTYTFQADVVENPFIRQKFPGLRVSWDLMRLLTTTTKFESAMTGDFNIEDTEDIRADLTNSLSIAINSMFAFKPSLQLLWRNNPALTSIDVFDDNGDPTGETVLVPLHKVDSFLNLALVVTLK